ncbi:glycosyl transferase [Flavobacterium crocinum]|uniref:Glycosyl transferase n=2 Tax=Flavobacterium crocinum TaxID=2183896 RepID=A0A2S1YG11_9FLAO|nr:glycosyl transferase [Flavobacterium crocinum]
MEKMITIIYPYRNRELNRITNSLNSLSTQSNKNFCVIFVDYGSDFDISESVQELLIGYNFVEYIHSFHNNQPWSRSKAINIGLRFTKTEYVFIADIDIIFHHNFIAHLFELKKENDNIYFQVGYLSEDESKKLKEFDNYNITSKSIPEGKGLSLFNLNCLLAIGGFDEFFHFWGAEDEDVHSRLIIAGFSPIFYNHEILLLHQWHQTFESLEHQKLTIQLGFSDAFNLNKKKLRFNQSYNILKPNNENWGKLISEDDFKILNSHLDSIILLNKKDVVENFLDIVLPNTKDRIINVVFKEDKYQSTLSYKIKSFLGIKVHDYYSLKQINDLLLKTLLIYYKDSQFNYRVSSDLKSVQLKINLCRG